MCTFFGTFVFSSIPQNVSFACNWSSMIYRRWALIYMQFWALNSINYLRSIELGDFFNQYERSFIMLVILNSINYWGSTRLFMIINAFIFDTELKKIVKLIWVFFLFFCVLMKHLKIFLGDQTSIRRIFHLRETMNLKFHKYHNNSSIKREKHILWPADNI